MSKTKTKSAKSKTTKSKRTATTPKRSGPGRPPFDPAVKLSQHVMVRLNVADHKLFALEAQRIGKETGQGALPAATYLRMAARAMIGKLKGAVAK